MPIALQRSRRPGASLAAQSARFQVVTRPTIYGNPFVSPAGDTAEAVAAYTAWLDGQPRHLVLDHFSVEVAHDAHPRTLAANFPAWLRSQGLAALRGLDLACSCPVTEIPGRCHRDVLILRANR